MRIPSKLRRTFSHPSPQEAKILVCILAASIAALDFSLPNNINIASFYFICIVLAAWTRSVRWLWASTAVFVFLSFGGIMLAPGPVVNPVTWVDWLNRGMTALALGVAAIPVHLRLRTITALEDTVAERDHAQLALQQSHASLEARVQERTQELQSEIAERIRTEVKLRESEQSMRQLSIRLIGAQEQERRRIARELHDSVGQYLVHSKVGLDLWLAKPDASEAGRQSISQVTDALERCLAETRNISYLLHPPLLDELGFAVAAKAYAEGFSRRSGIHVKLDVPDAMTRLPSALELVLFRVLQESLTNVLRHAQSPTVEIHVQVQPKQITLIVRDYGKGMPQDLVDKLNTGTEASGVGLSGMRERVVEFRGRLDIHSDETGTEIRAVLPLANSNSAKTVASHS
jgi:signal transduction histidine kinase